MRKKSVQKTAKEFRESVDDIQAFLDSLSPDQSKEHVSWLHEYAIIRLYRDFEWMVLSALVGAINNDTTTISERVGIEFPHLTDEVCEYLIIGDGFFDFKGRDGLIGTFKRYVPPDHYLVTVIKDPKYRASLEQLSALRNLAAHDSTVSRKRAKDVVKQERMGSAGSWLKAQGRFQTLLTKLKQLAEDLEKKAPY